MARRTLIAAKGDYELSLRCMKETIEWRQEMKIDDLRECFYVAEEEKEKEDESRAKALRKLAMDIQQELACGGSDNNAQPRMFVRGCDKEGHAILHLNFCRRFELQDRKLWLQSIVYMFERAIAASRKEKIIFCVNLRGASLKTLPPQPLIKELIQLLSQHYCERLHRVYLVDAPLKYRSVWSVIRPFLDPVTKKKFVWVAGSKEKLAEVGSAMDASQAMPYMLPTGELTSDVNTREFLYETPFGELYRGAAATTETPFDELHREAAATTAEA